jgi:hypothetical protein
MAEVAKAGKGKNPKDTKEAKGQKGGKAEKGGKADKATDEHAD